MKKLFLTSILFLSVSLSFAQTQDSSKLKCSYYKNETDEFTGVKKIILNEENIISFTDSALKYLYKKKDLINCKTYCARLDSMYVIYFNWTILDKSAYETYGSIEKDASLMIKFKDGTICNLKFGKYDLGKTDYEANSTAYSSYCLITKEDREQLINNEIDKIRMYWSKGYDAYPVTNSSVFKNQLPCLK